MPHISSFIVSNSVCDFHHIIIIVYTLDDVVAAAATATAIATVASIFADVRCRCCCCCSSWSFVKPMDPYILITELNLHLKNGRREMKIRLKWIRSGRINGICNENLPRFDGNDKIH